MSYKILVTGGAGYVGSALIGDLLEESYEVTVVDNLLFDNGYTMLSFFKNPNFTFVKGDVRDKSLMKDLVKDKDFVIHLAAIVGYPACEKDPRMAKDVNYNASKILSELLSKDQILIFSSTGSNYGNIESGVCTEDVPLKPLSLYGKAKTDSEKLFLDKNKSIIYRFATAFGLSPRMRFDLLINDFVYQAMFGGTLIMFERNFKRTFIHVDDMSRSLLFALENHELMVGQAYNVGGEKNNLTKKEVAEIIKKKIDYYLHFADYTEDIDKRNYTVSYDKINSLGFDIQKTVEEGIEEIIKAKSAFEKRHFFKNV
tara:strand:- start:919 stop:1857 length:939 start_codon:yes stop_codon:yes gene_type:complete